MASTKKIPLSEIIDLYQNKHWTMRQIADHFGLTKQAIHNRLDRAGIHRRLRGVRPPIIEQSVLEELYVKERMSMVKVADRLGTTTTRIRHWLKAHRIPRRRRGILPKHPEIGALAIGESVDLPKTSSRNSHAVFYGMAKHRGIRISARTLNETTMCITRKA